MKDSSVQTRSIKDLVVLCAYRESVLPGRVYGPIIRSAYIIECCTEGAGSVTINGKEHPFSAGDSYVLFPGDHVKHSSDPVTGRKGCWCALNGPAPQKYLAAAGISSDYPFLPASLFGEVSAIISSMADAHTSNDMGAFPREIGCAYSLLGTLTKNVETQSGTDVAERAIGIMTANLHEDFNVGELARSLGYDRSYFSTIFKEKTGHSPHKYLTNLRLAKAREFLKTEDYSVSETAEFVGLDPHNFSRLFLREFGKTPKDYRDEIKNMVILDFSNTK